MIVTLAGAIGSGKSTLAKALGNALGAPAYSFSGYVRSVVDRRGLDSSSRTVLQDVGHALVLDDPRVFLDQALAWGGHRPGADLLLDGLRHLSVLDALRARQVEGVEPVLLIYLDTSPSTRELRAKARGDDPEKLRLNEAHPAEHDLHAGLREGADLVLDGDLDQDALVAKALAFIEAAR